MNRRNKKETVRLQTIFSVSFAALVAYATINQLHLQIDQENIKNTAIYVAIAEIVAFYLKNSGIKKIRQAVLESLRSNQTRKRSRGNEVLRKYVLTPIMLLSLFLLVLNVIENTSTAHPYTALKDATWGALTGNSSLVHAFAGDRGSQNESESSFQESYQAEIKSEISRVFGSQADTAILIATRESSLLPEVIGDKNLMFIDPNTGEMIGDSIGIFQIRTGGINQDGAIWNRARMEGMTAEQFRKWLQDPYNNISYAYELYSDWGWDPWSTAP